MIEDFFKRIIPKQTLLFKLLYNVWRYKFWFPGEWKFDVLDWYASKKEQVSFIQIGSNNGVTGDPLHRHIITKRWSGVLVEPVPYLFEELRKNYGSSNLFLRFENSAIASTKGKLKFFRLQQSEMNDLPLHYDQLGSFNKEVILRHRSGIPHFDELFIEDYVNAITFEDLLLKYNLIDINLIHIDTEGYDFEILKMIPLKRLGIELIMFEHVHLQSRDYRSALKLLKRNGFVCARANTDTIAVKKNLKFSL